jgi:site-specific DNA-adenine methylase
VYCDPPYAPLSATASFAQYTARGFSALDQLWLQRAVTRAAKRGASVIVSNSSAPEIEALYGSAQAQRAGLMIRRVEARRAINSRADGRGAIAELIISNTQPGVPPAIRPKMARAGLARGLSQDTRARAR